MIHPFCRVLQNFNKVTLIIKKADGLEKIYRFKEVISFKFNRTWLKLTFNPQFVGQTIKKTTKFEIELNYIIEMRFDNYDR